VSSRRNASLVVALGVASLAATSLAAMVATSELLVESFDYPVSGRLDPPVPDLGGPGVLEVEPPRPGRGKRPAGRSRAPAAEPAPRPTPAGRPARGGAAASPDGGRAIVVVVVRRPARQEPDVRRPSAGDLRPARAVRPPHPRPAHTKPAWPQRPRRRWTNHKPNPGKRVRATPIPRPAPPAPVPPRPADPEGEPGGGAPCPDHVRPTEERPWPDENRHRWDGNGRRHDDRHQDPTRDRQRDGDRRQDPAPDRDGDRPEAGSG
jgi:translation initiation factor IF-2